MNQLDVMLLTAQPEYALRGLVERLVVPLLYFTVFLLLPMTLVRRRPEPIFSVGMGPLLCFHRQAYKAAGGHQAVKGCILEDVSLARAVKSVGYQMAVMDATKLVRCYMYVSFLRMP